MVSSTLNPHSQPGWTSLRNKRVSIGRALDEPCAKCHGPIDYTISGRNAEGPTADHMIPLGLGGELLPAIEDLQVMHHRCNSSAGPAIAKARRTANKLEKVFQPPETIRNSGAESSSNSSGALGAHPPPLLASLSPNGLSSYGYQESPMVTNPYDPIWDKPWLSDLQAVPSDAQWPRWMSAPHPAARDSLGREVEVWAFKELGITMRWWQKLALRRQLEVDADGRLVWFTVVESTPRRSGKSTRLRISALWRLWNAAHFGEEQLIMLTGKDLQICKEIHRRAWPWAERAGLKVRKANGQEEIEIDDGSRWMVRGRASIYGYDICHAQVDEAWAVEPSVVDDGLEPALLERMQPQLILTSTAHRRATGLMIDRRAVALSQLMAPTDDILLMHWGAEPSAEVSDRKAWRESSPMWSPERERLMARALSRMLSGTERDLDEPDPLEAFRSQYLNIWPHHVTVSKHWMPSDLLTPCGVEYVEATPLAAALEVSVDGTQWSAAVADGGRANLIVGVSLPAALVWLRERDITEVLVHQAVSHQLPPEFVAKHVTISEATAALSTLADSIRTGSIVWDNAEALYLQFGNVVTAPGMGGPRVADRLSKGPVEAVKALSWAHWMASFNPVEMPQIF
jgi:hypothetical protein